MIGIRTFLTVCVLAWRFSACGADTNQILFLRVKLKDGAVSLIESTVKPGTLKTSPNSKKRPIQFVVETASDQSLWECSIDDPRIARLETANPDSGVLEPVIIQRDESEFTIRVPVTHGMHHVSFYRQPRAAADAGGNAKKVERTLIGKILTPAPQ